jgi:uncharacterized protein involved in outer membrane biogenesis
MTKIFLSILSVLILIIGAMLVIPSFVDWGQYREQIKTRVAEATGYQITINDELNAAFLPYPHITLGAVEIDGSNAEGPYTVNGQVERLSIAVALMPLLSKEIVISDISLIKPVLTVQENAVEETAQTTEDNARANTATTALQIDQFYIEDGAITYQPLNGEAMALAIPSLTLQADSLSGPFNFESELIYQDLPVAVNGSIGALNQTEPTQVNVAILLDEAELNYNGLIDMSGETLSYQGEVTANASKLSPLYQRLNGEALPFPDSAMRFSGLVEGSQGDVKLTNGNFTYADMKAGLSAAVQGLDADTKNITAALDFSTPVNLDKFIQSDGTQNNQSSTDGGAKNYRFMPETLSIPAGMNADITLNAPSIMYQGRAMEGVSLEVKKAATSINGSFALNSLPGGGSTNMDFSLNPTSTSRDNAADAIIFADPALQISGNFAVQSLKTIAVDWLKLVEADTFDNPQMPQSASGQITAKIQGNRAMLNAPQLSIEPYDMSGVKLAYINQATPVIDLNIQNFEGATVGLKGTLDATQGVTASLSHPNAARFIQVFQPDFEASPITNSALQFQGLVLQDGDILSINNMNATIGSITANGTARLNNGGAIPAIAADLTFGNLDTQVLLTGKASTASTNSTRASSSGQSPWSRDAIDTSFMRSINLDLNAKANRLIHGNWLISNPTIDIDLNGGVLDINAIQGGLFGGQVNLSGKAEAREAGRPLSVNASINANQVDLNRMVQAALSQNKKHIDGTGSFTMDISASGISSSALIYALNGDGRIETGDLTIYGLDLNRVAEAIADESLTDLGRVIQGAFNNGQTAFQPVNHPLTIREGTMPVNNFELISAPATLSANGEVSFSRWMMDITNTVDFTLDEGLPSVSMTIKGPLDAPKQNVASDVLRSFIVNKYGAKVQNKVQEFIGKELGEDSPATGIINNLLGLPQQQKQAPAQAPAPVNDNEVEQTQEVQEVEQTPAPQPEQSPEEQIIRGIFDQIR